MMSIVQVIGFGLSIDDLTETHKRIIKNAELLVGGKRHLELLKSIENQNISRETFAITKDIEGLIAIIKDRVGQGKRVVVVASGDPLFHGIGGTLVNALGKENVNIYPNISSVVAAFAAIKEPWHDAKFISLHGNIVCQINKLAIPVTPTPSPIGRGNNYSLPLGRGGEGQNNYLENYSLDDAQDRSCQSKLSQNDTLKNHRLIAILTDHKKTPAWIAKSLIEDNISDFEMYVFENLGADNQNISFYGDIREVAEKPFLSPNVVILKRKELQYKELECKELGNELFTLKQSPLKIYSGMEDNLFFHEKGLITKSEIRAIVLSKLQLISDDHIFWDLGAGSGSVSIEVSRFIPKGKIFAVEKNINRVEDIKNNMARFGICDSNRVGQGGAARTMMSVIHGELPDAIGDLPDPDRIFIGGGGKNISEIISRAGERLKNSGIMVINTALIQTMNISVETLKKMGFHVKLNQVQVSVSKEMPFGDRLEALNPVWIIYGKKKMG
ncbi:MAG: precorrin-6y C5,15-methyltransferase (decarboxylating) subunit CbiE [Desulfamplus sp.]|nr:precorrin-6y C5,15-methyltransferase (decarboxylating) subunit CbiE [Desulfamplus sp.]